MNMDRWYMTTANAKKCSSCKEIKFKKDFHKRKDSKDGYRNECKDCRNTKAAKRYHSSPEIKGKAIKNAKKKHIGHAYGITVEEYNECMSTSDCCEICGSTKKLCYDHDHNTMEFRGVLCHLCNSSLGTFGDNEEGILKVLKYLRRKND